MQIENDWGFVFSGGAARGIIHIGVLKAFEEVGFKPSCIAGTSIGAVVGSFYASGMSPDDMMKLLSGKRFLNMFSLKPSLTGLLDMRYLKEVLKKYLPERFEDLKIPLYITACNLHTEKTVVFKEGLLHRAVLASATIPVLFKPIIIDGESYVDGGVLDNLPAFACKDRCAKLLGIDVNHGKFALNLDNMKNVAIEVFHLVVTNNSLKGLELCDSVIRPKLNEEHQLLDFTKAKELFAIGYEEGMKWIETNQASSL